MLEQRIGKDHIGIRGSRNFEPHVRLYYSNSRFVLKTADTLTEVFSALHLRSRVFKADYHMDDVDGLWDFDNLDECSDHLILKEKATGQVVACYRLLSSTTTGDFYSETEFQFGPLRRYPGVKLELGRACVDPDFRNGVAIALLWKGLGSYIRALKPRLVFGCASFKTEDHSQARALYEGFKERGELWKKILPPNPNFQIPNWNNLIPNGNPMEIPALVQLYLRAGARIASEPAWDRAFHCLDFLTVLETEKLDEKFSLKFQCP